MGGKGGGGGEWQLQFPGGGGSGQKQQSAGRSQQPATGEKADRSFGSGRQSSAAPNGKYTNWGAVGKEAGKGALYGSPTPGTTVLGSAFMAGRELARQYGEQNAGPLPGVPNISATARKRAGADREGRPLSAGQIPMRAGSSYGRYPSQGPPLRRGGSLISDNDETDSLGSGPTSADLNDFSF